MRRLVVVRRAPPPTRSNLLYSCLLAPLRAGASMRYIATSVDDFQSVPLSIERLLFVYSTPVPVQMIVFVFSRRAG